MRRIILWTVFGLSTIIAVVWLLSPKLVWDGAAIREVNLMLLDDRTSAPIAGARVRHNDREFAITDAEGKCRGLMSFGAGGTRSIFGRSGNWRISGQLNIATADSRTYAIELDSLVTKPLRRMSDKAPVEITIRVDSTGPASP